MNILNLSRFFTKKESVKEEKGAYNALSPYVMYRTGRGEVFAFSAYSVSELVQNYTKIAPLNSAINRISNAVGALPFLLVNKATGEKVRDHKILALLNAPNSEHQKTKRDFFRDIALWKTLSGDAFVVATGNVTRAPLELFVQNSQHFEGQPDEKGYPKTYKYDDSFASEVFYRDKVSQRFYNQTKNQELLNITGFNPNRGGLELEGLSEASPLFYELNQYVHAAQFNLSLLTNGARPSGAFVVKAPNGQVANLSEEAYQRLQMEISETYTGSANAGRPMLLEGGLEWVQTSVNPKDMDFKALKDDAEKQIYKTLGVPLELVMAVGTTYDNLDKVRLEFYENRVLPLAEDLLENIGRWLLPRYSLSPVEWHLMVDIEAVDVLTSVRSERRKLIEDSMVMTINEKRVALGLDVIDGGDKIVDANGRPIAGRDANGDVVRANPGATPAPQPTITTEGA